MKPRFVILYGSQKGQAQSIAEGIAEEAEEHGLLADLSCLDQSDKYNLEKENSPVVLIVSTTGDGEPPDNAIQFVKHIKKKNLSTDHYKHLCYAILALGDTNYANFCNCGKTIERRLQELGATQFYATGYADDGVGLEIVVDPWLEGLWKAIKGALSKMSSNRNRDSAKETSDLSSDALQLNLLSLTENENSDALQLNLLSLTENKNPELVIRTSVSDSQVTSVTPSSASSGQTGATDGTHKLASQSLGCVPTTAPGIEASNDGVLHDAVAASLTHSWPPLSESPLNVPALPPPFLDVSLQAVDTAVEVTGPLNRDTLYEVPISRAVQLAKGESVKTVLLLELDISAHPTLSYNPGDSFDVVCPNRACEVEDILNRLGCQDQKHHLVHVSLCKNTAKKGARVPSYISQNISLLYLFTWCLEIRSVPKKAFLRALVEYTKDSAQKRRLQELCSKQGAADYNLYIRDQSLSILELLMAFPSCSPPINLLIEHLPKLQPRPYSAASSSLMHPGKLHFVLSVVEFPACSGRPVGKRGLCTGWLFDLINPVLVSPQKAESSSLSTLTKIHVSLRPNCAFRPPSDPVVPIIMVGPGTGVAPFIGFLQQREKEMQENPKAIFGETWLFFGCRHRDQDYLFREELENFVSCGILNYLKVCFSRDNEGDEGSAGRPRYVQHNMLLNSQQIINILLEQKGYLYVCGDAKNMAKEVNDILVEMIKTEIQVDQLEAMKRLAGLREEKRYLQDIWG